MQPSFAWAFVWFILSNLLSFIDYDINGLGGLLFGVPMTEVRNGTWSMVARIREDDVAHQRSPSSPLCPV
jgi:hypothetical protein